MIEDKDGYTFPGTGVLHREALQKAHSYVELISQDDLPLWSKTAAQYQARVSIETSPGESYNTGSLNHIVEEGQLRIKVTLKHPADLFDILTDMATAHLIGQPPKTLR